MYIATIDYYDHETGHRKTTVDPRLLFKLVKSVKSGTCRCKWKNTIWRAFKGSYHLVPVNAHQLRFPVAYNTPLVPTRQGLWVCDKSGKVRNDIGIGDVLVISEDDDIETVDKKVGDVLRAWGYPGRPPFALCEHMERL